MVTPPQVESGTSVPHDVSRIPITPHESKIRMLTRRPDTQSTTTVETRDQLLASTHAAR